MQKRDYIVYDWSIVAAALNKLAKQDQPRYFEKRPEGNFLKDIYQNNLPHTMQNLFARYLVADRDRNDPDMQILINAQKQLNDLGFIGKHDSLSGETL